MRFFLSEPGETIIEAEALYSFPGFPPTRPYGARTGNKVEVNPWNENKNENYGILQVESLTMKVAIRKGVSISVRRYVLQNYF